MEESLTPDTDELEAHRQNGFSGNGGEKKGRGSGVRQATAWLLLLLVVVVAGAGGWTLWEQQRQLLVMKQSLERIQGELHASQQQLASVDHERTQTGEVIEEQLEFLDSEMRKLWVIAHERNRPAIESLESEMAETGERLSSVESSQEEYASGLSDTQDRLATLSDEVSDRPDVEARVSDVEARVSDVEILVGDVEALTSDVESLTGEVESLVSEQTEARERLEQSLTQRVDRLERDRRLALEELAARLDGLERELDAVNADQATDGEVDALTERVQELEEIMDSVDRSRQQLTRRYVNLSERVDRLSNQ